MSIIDESATGRQFISEGSPLHSTWGRLVLRCTGRHRLENPARRSMCSADREIKQHHPCSRCPSLSIRAATPTTCLRRVHLRQMSWAAYTSKQDKNSVQLWDDDTGGIYAYVDSRTQISALGFTPSWPTCGHGLASIRLHVLVEDTEEQSNVT